MRMLADFVVGVLFLVFAGLAGFYFAEMLRHHPELIDVILYSVTT
jgi:hypothetical protein